MKTLTKIRPRSHHRAHFAVPRKPKLVGQWQRGLETMFGTRTVEIAFNVRAFATAVRSG
jgi:hypothetical protein